MLDSSRRLRMDESRPTFPHPGLCEPIGSDAAPTARNVQCESSPLVYCGTAQEVSEGFAIALRAMGLDATFLPAGIALATNTPNTEDN
jgi:hypothetical protein